MIGEKKDVVRIAPDEMRAEAARVDDVAVAAAGIGLEHSGVETGDRFVFRAPAMKEDKARAVLVKEQMIEPALGVSAVAAFHFPRDRRDLGEGDEQVRIAGPHVDLP